MNFFGIIEAVNRRFCGFDDLTLNVLLKGSPFAADGFEFPVELLNRLVHLLIDNICRLDNQRPKLAILRIYLRRNRAFRTGSSAALRLHDDLILLVRNGQSSI